MKKPDPLQETLVNPSRRSFIKTTAAAAVVAAAVPSFLSTRSYAAAGRPIKIGFVSPKSGPLAEFAEADDFVFGNINKLWANGLEINGTVHPIQIIVKDSRSDPNRASEVTSQLIKADKVDLIMTANTPETVVPVASQAELDSVPCITTDAPWQPYYFRGGKAPDKGYNWTYHFFWGAEDMSELFTDMWLTVPTNKVVGALWGNDNDGNAFGDPKLGFPPVLAKKGFTLVDSGRFPVFTNDFSAQISKFKSAKVEIVTGVLPPPAFVTFWSQAAQQSFKPKILTMAKALLFPSALNALGDRGDGLSTEVWWTPNHPFKSSLNGQTAKQFCEEYERVTKKQWTQPTGFKHALFEVAANVLKRCKNIDSPAAIRDAIAATKIDTIVGHVEWTGNPVKNVSKTPLVGGQWVRGKKYKYELQVVDNIHFTNIPTQGKLKSL